MLDTIRLENFKAFRSAEIGLGRLTLLSGLNSSGKSTVLQALALVCQSRTDVLSADGEQGLLLDGEFVELGTGQDVLHDDPGASSGDRPHISIALCVGEVVYLWHADYYPNRDLLPASGEVVQSLEATAYPACFDVGFQYLKADRIVPATSFPRSHQVAISRGFLGTRGEHTVNFLRHHTEFRVEHESVRHGAAKSHLLVDQVEAWMQELCPGVNLEASGIDGTDSVRLSYGFGGTAGLSATRRRRPTNVGFGLTYVLPVVVACLTAKPGSLILLENPEAHLHPRGQSRITALICGAAASGAQVVVETHSDHVLNAVRVAVKQGRMSPDDVVLHYFQGNGSGVEILTPRVGSDGMLSEWPPGFFDEWDTSLDQLLG